MAEAVRRIGSGTDENSASSEELAASAEELGAQSQGLQEIVNRFKTMISKQQKPQSLCMLAVASRTLAS